MKRYSIVRVDGECPKGFNEDIYCKWCGNCGRLYGDTKEQLIAKVEQILWQEMKKEFVSKHTISSKPIARKIVEFLGVEQ